MTADTFDDPFYGDIPDSVPLANAPLARVLGCVRFERISKMETEAYIAGFQDAIRDKYPRFQRGVVSGIDTDIGGNAGASARISSVLWRMSDETGHFRVILGADAIMLDTDRYTSRDDFLTRFEFILKSFGNEIEFLTVNDVYVKYIDRISNENDLYALPDLVKDRILNVPQFKFMEEIEFSINEIVGKTKEGKIRAIYGIIPPNYTYDPDLVPALGDRNWVLDVTSHSIKENRIAFNPGELRQELYSAAARAYAFFRWSTSTKFLDYFGCADTNKENTS